MRRAGPAREPDDYLGEFLGVLLIFLGFLVSIEVFSDIRLPFTRIVLARREKRGRESVQG